MKILLSAYACRPHSGTEPGNGWHWAVNLAQHKHEVWCFTSTRNKQYIDEQLCREPIAGLHFVYAPVPAWVETLQKKNHYKFVYLHYYFWQKAAYRIAHALHQEYPFDLAHHVTYGSLQMGSRLWQLPIPFIFGPVGGGQKAPSALKKYLGENWFFEYLRSLSVALQLRVFHTKSMLQSAQLVLTTNQETYDLAASRGASHLKMELDTALPSNFFPEEKPSQNADNQLNVLWVGTMHPRKGVDLLLDVFLGLPHNITLTLVGGGALEQSVRNKVRQRGLDQQVHCVGQVPYEKVKEYYRTHDVFVFCSLRDSFGSQLLEAMAYGLPIVTLDHQGAHDFVPDNAGIKIPVTEAPEIIREIQAALLHLQHNAHERRAMGANAFAYAKGQRWDEKVQHTVKDYYSLFAKQH